MEQDWRTREAWSQNKLRFEKLLPHYEFNVPLRCQKAKRKVIFLFPDARLGFNLIGTLNLLTSLFWRLKLRLLFEPWRTILVIMSYKKVFETLQKDTLFDYCKFGWIQNIGIPYEACKTCYIIDIFWPSFHRLWVLSFPYFAGWDTSISVVGFECWNPLYFFCYYGKQSQSS